MARQDYTLFDSFQDKGYWWLPETPRHQVPGILFHSEEETRLELFGDLYEESLEEKGIVKQPRPVPIILGWMEDQGVCTLYKNHRTSQQLHVPGGVGSAVWASQAVFLGKHFPKPDEIVFSSMGVNYPNLEEWVGEPPFKMPTHKMEGDRIVGYESVYVARDAIEVDVPTYDVPMQIRTVEEKRAKSYQMTFGDEESQKNLSSVTHVARGKHIPPFLILHVADHPETRAQSQRLAKALQAAGVPATAYPAEGKNHTTINNDLGLAGDRPTEELFGFLARVLKR